MNTILEHFALLVTYISLSACAFDPNPHIGDCTLDTDCTNQVAVSYCDFDRKVDCNVGVCKREASLVPVSCECNKETHIPNGSNQSCYAIRDHLGLQCSYDFQCPKGSQCRDGRVCSCSVVKVESKLKPDTCLPQSYIGYECDEDAQCGPVMGPSSECVGPATNKTCQCKQGHFYYHTHDIEYAWCYPFAPIGGRCKDRRQCVDATGSGAHTTCLSIIGDYCVCKCTQYYTREHEGICLDRAHIGDECSSDVQCKLWNEGPALCDSVTKKCVCDDNYQKNLFDNGCDLI